jgi:ArsR family transcriptional regulator
MFLETWYKFSMATETDAAVARFADMFAAIGTEPRLRIVRLLLAAHPAGMIAGELGSELELPPSTLSHHLDRLKREGVVRVRREGTFLWYTANTAALEELLRFLYAECCTRNCACDPAHITEAGPKGPALQST